MKSYGVMVYFSIRESKVNKRGLSPIEVSISYNRERIYFSTGKSAKPSDWNKQKQVVKKSNPESLLLNDFLVKFRNKIYQKEIDLIKRGLPVTVYTLKDAVLDNVESLKDKSLMQMINEYNNEKKELVGKGVAPLTYKYCVRCCKILNKYIKEKYKREDISLHEVNVAL